MADVALPTEAEVDRLPRWAKVAFAARCARRVLPVFRKNWPDAPQEHIAAVNRAVEVIEQIASNPADDYADDYVAADAADAAYDAAKAAKAASAAFAADAAHAAAYATRGPAYAARAAAKAVKAGAFNRATIVQFVRSDFEFLLKASRVGSWTDETPVPSSVFGPLDEPSPALTSSDPIEADEYVVMSLRAFGEPGVSASTLAGHLLAMYKALNQYTLAKYGRHLSRGRFRRLVLLHSGVPA